MPPSDFKPHSGRYLSFAEREEIAILRAYGYGIREIAQRLRRAPSTISRELRRNAATRGGRLVYRAVIAQWHRDRRAVRPKAAKLAANHRLRSYVQDRLAGLLRTPDGRPVTGSGDCPVERPQPWASAGSSVGELLEPGTDREPPAGGVPR